jgi:predicted transcriptional regulator
MSINRKAVLSMQSGWTRIPNRLLELATTLTKQERRIYRVAIAVYCVLMCQAENFHPSVGYLANALATTKGTVSQALDFLVRQEIIKKHKRGRGYRVSYEFTDPNSWPKSEENHVVARDASVSANSPLSAIVGRPAGHNKRRKNTKEANTSLSEQPRENSIGKPIQLASGNFLVLAVSGGIPTLAYELVDDLADLVGARKGESCE